MCSGRGFIRSLLHKCTVCRKYQGQTYSCPEAPPLTTSRLEDAYPFYVTGIDNFRPFFVKNVFLMETVMNFIRCGSRCTHGLRREV